MTSHPEYDDALAIALAAVAPHDRVEQIETTDASGRILASAIRADRDLPPFHRAQMDGYAVRASEIGTQSSWPVVATIPAGASPDVAVPPGSCVAIATGAALPDDVDTVIQHELSDRRDPVTFEIDRIDSGHAVHPRGADAVAGQTIVAEGTVLHAHHLGLAATVGMTTISTRARPRVTVLTSGDEVIPPGDPLVATHQIRNSNAPLVGDLIQRMGGVVDDARHLPDERDVTVAALGEALCDSDIVVTIGGVSAGERDWFPVALDHHAARPLITGARIQPGKPIRVARTDDGTLVVCLPGNPVSAMACSCLFLWPLVRRLLDLPTALPWHTRMLVADVRPNTRRTAFRPGITVGHDRVEIPAWAGSGDLVHTATTHGLTRLPREPDPVPAGTPVPFLPWPGGTT